MKIFTTACIVISIFLTAVTAKHRKHRRKHHKHHRHHKHHPHGGSAIDKSNTGSTDTGKCQFYLDFVKQNILKSVQVPGNNPTPLHLYDCTFNGIPRCPKGDGGTWSGDATWVWNKGIDSSTDEYRYNTIWFMQLIGDSDDLFHECDDTSSKNSSPIDPSKVLSTPLQLIPDCIAFGKWCRAWTGHVLKNKKIKITDGGKDQMLSVEDAFHYLSSNTNKIDFANQPITDSRLRQMDLQDQKAIVAEWLSEQDNCITDQHYCMECNGDPNHCSVAQGCVLYKDSDGNNFCP